METCTDPCGLNRSDEAASTAADDDLIRITRRITIRRTRLDKESHLGPGQHKYMHNYIQNDINTA